MSDDFIPKSFADFDGQDDFIALPPIDADWSRGLTIEAWARVEAGSRDARIIELGNGAANANIILGSGAEASHLMAQLFSKRGQLLLRKEGGLEAGVWMHLAVSVGATGGKLYRDGQLILSSPLKLPDKGRRALNYIGKSSSSSDGYFHGQLAEVRLWNIARSAAKLQRDRCRPLSGHESGLVAYFPLDDGDGTIARDRGRHGFFGTLHGARFVAPAAASASQPAPPPPERDALQVQNAALEQTVAALTRRLAELETRLAQSPSPRPLTPTERSPEGPVDARQQTARGESIPPAKTPPPTAPPVLDASRRPRRSVIWR